MTTPAPIRRLAHTAAVTHLRETVAVLVAVAAVGIGLSMLLDPDAYRVPTFGLALRWVAPQGWGAMHILVGAMLLWSIILDRRTVHLPATALGCMWAAWAALITIDAADGSGVPGVAMLFTLAELLAGLVAVGYWLTRYEET